MPTEKGVVIRAEGGFAWIRTEKSNACEGCASRDSCGNPGGGKEMEVEALNNIDAKVGDQVLISFGAVPLFKVYTLVYLFPILALLLGAILGQWLTVYVPMDESLSALMMGVVFFAGAFFIVKFCGARMAEKGNYQPVVLRIVSSADHPSL